MIPRTELRMPSVGVKEDLAIGVTVFIGVFLLFLVLFTFLSRQASIMPQKGITPQYAIGDWGELFHTFLVSYI